MRGRIQMLAIAVLCTAAMHFATAQESRAVAGPAMSGTTANGGTTARESNMNTSTASADPTVAPATTAVAADTTAKKHKKKDKKSDAENMRPDDPRKNPWWDPKDWEYIYNQGP